MLPLEPKRGRPKENLPLVDVGMTETERDIFDLLLRVHKERKPDFDVADEIHLRSAGMEYIKYLRQTQDELISGKGLPANKQSPLIQMREELKAFYDGTGKARPATATTTDVQEFFLRKSQTRAD